MSVHECQMSIHRSRHGERKTQQYERYSCATFVSAVLHSLVTFATNIKDYKYSPHSKESDISSTPLYSHV